jgi:hypothetical protein
MERTTSVTSVYAVVIFPLPWFIPTGLAFVTLSERMVAALM